MCVKVKDFVHYFKTKKCNIYMKKVEPERMGEGLRARVSVGGSHGGEKWMGGACMEREYMLYVVLKI